MVSRPYRTTVTCLLALSLVLLAYPVLRSAWDIEIDSNEGWNAYYQLRAIAGQSLYVNESPLFFNNYPPLSFYMVGALTALTGDPMIAGRALSLVALLIIAVASGTIVRNAGGTRTDAALSVATCIALFSSFATDYLGMNDPQLLGQCFVVVGLAVYVRRPLTPAGAALVAVLFSIGVLTKHNLLAVPLVVAADISIRGSNRNRLSFFATGLGLAALSAVLIWLLTGPTFFAQVLAPRVWSVERAFLSAIDLLSRLQAPVAVVGLTLLGCDRRPFGLILGYLMVALALGIAFAGGANTDINVFFDLFIALGIGAGMAAHELSRRLSTSAAAAAVAVLINVGVIFYAPLAIGRMIVDVGGEMTGRENLFHTDVDYLKGIEGTALCQSQLLCFRAGKPMFYDSFNVNQAILAGRLPTNVLIDKLHRQEIPVLQISDVREHSPTEDYPGVQSMPVRFVHFSDQVFDALETYYMIDRVGVSGKFYRPRPRQ